MADIVHMFNIIPADALAANADRASAGIILSMLLHLWVSAPQFSPMYNINTSCSVSHIWGYILCG